MINLNKPSGITSRQAVTRVKQMLSARKAGHAGTLDPMATGVLLICLNEATKITRFFTNMDKQYHARIKLGERTDTYDSEGTVIQRNDVSSVTQEKIIGTISMFQGRMKQKPPMHSAVKIKGKTLYTLARKGIEIERPDRDIEIYSIDVIDISLPFVDILVLCSKGTYVRTLCDDIGLRLGIGAHLAHLQRIRIGHFDIKDATSFDDLLSGTYEWYSIDAALPFLKEVRLDRKDFERMKNGAHIPFDKNSELGTNELVKLKGPEGDVFGIGCVHSGSLKTERIFNL
ncbi:MAG: tRNA pseudouridine(55) synthase TruB [Nitrospiraceae bacterium]|nr:MAG: tRNA pseudouridine(55) synthase TruB [Nitrospiraceae bacterium]